MPDKDADPGSADVAASALDVHRWPGGGRSRPSEATGVYAHMLHVDPPDHTRLRRLVQKPFASRRAALRPRAEEIAARLLDEMAAVPGDVTDLLGAYARPLPIAVLCELLGIPEADRAWIDVTVTAYDKPAEHDRVERELAAYFTDLIAAKRADPGDDLVSALVVASDNADADAAENSGADGGLTGNELVPTLPADIEELLRFTNPVNHANDRFTTEDLPVGDVVIPAGEWVLPAISSANRDPALPWPAWRPRSPSAPCSPASLDCRSRSPGGTPLASCQPRERSGIPPRPPRLSRRACEAHREQDADRFTLG